MKKLSSVMVFAFAVLLASAGAPSTLHAANFVEGTHYFPLPKPQPVQTGNKIEVLEWFWYGCPHCYRLQPFMERWQHDKPDNAEYVGMPAVFNKSWEIHARAWFTFEALGLTEQFHRKFFDAIHIDRRPITDAESVADFAAANGVERGPFLEAMTSFGVESQLKRAIRRLPGYNVSGVPTVIVDGKYRASVSSAGSHDTFIELINFLVEKSATER